jgi:hypothetical protein
VGTLCAICFDNVAGGRHLNWRGWSDRSSSELIAGCAGRGYAAERGSKTVHRDPHVTKAILGIEVDLQHTLNARDAQTAIQTQSFHEL